ncbi:MAG TPA: BNR-4 repeat-containing protein [Candidatus Limnocylindrales bacterium]
MRLRTAWRAMVCAGLTAGLAFGLAVPAQAATIAVLPFRMDASNQAGWWKPIDEFNGRVYVAYNAWGSASAGGSGDTHTVYVASRDASDPAGTWTRGCVKASATAECTVFGDDIGHNNPTVVVDGDGFIHAFVSMHNHDWRYYRSTVPGDVTTLVRATMPDTGKFTYPNATRVNNGDVYLIVREYSTEGEGRLYRWNNAANTWSRVATFARDNSYVVYPDDVIGDANGDVHIAWEWAYDSANGLRHYGSYVRYSPATNTFHNAAGAALSLPVTHTSPIIYQPIEAAETPIGRDNAAGLQSAKLSLNQATGRPIVAYRYRSSPAPAPFRVKLAEWNGAGWVRSVVYGGAYDTYAAVDITTFGASGIRVYYAKMQTIADDHAFVATRSGTTWSETLLLSNVPIERLAVTRRGTTDHLYLASPGTHQLFYGTHDW